MKVHPLRGLAEGESSGAQVISGTPGSTAIGDATKDAADVNDKATTIATIDGGVEDKVKAAEAAKVVVTQLEQALNVLKANEARAAPEAKGQLQSQIGQLQAKLDTAKVDAADKDAQAKSATTTTSGTTTGGGVEDKVKAADEAKATVTGLESQLSALKAAQAGTIPQAKGVFDGPIAATQNALDAAKKNAADKDAQAKSATTTTPATTEGTKPTNEEGGLQFPTTEAKDKFNTASKDLNNLKTQRRKRRRG